MKILRNMAFGLKWVNSMLNVIEVNFLRLSEVFLNFKFSTLRRKSKTLNEKN